MFSKENEYTLELCSNFFLNKKYNANTNTPCDYGIRYQQNVLRWVLYQTYCVVS